MSQLVQLDGEGSSIALLVPETGMPLLLHWGVRLTAPLDNATAEALAVRASRINGLDESVAAATLLPTGGLGFFGWPALAGHRSGRDFIQSLTGWDVVRDEKSATLAARDDIVGLRLEINLELHPGGALTMRSALVNEGREPFILDRMMAGTMMVPERATELLTFDGMWGAEFQPIRGVRPASLLLRENRRGRTSHNRYPALVLGTPGFSENAGEVWGLHLGWSGNHVVALDSLDDGRCLVHAGELFEPGEWIIDAGDEYRSPVVTMAYGAGGLESLARSFHAYVRHALLAWPGGRMRPRPAPAATSRRPSRA